MNWTAARYDDEYGFYRERKVHPGEEQRIQPSVQLDIIALAEDGVRFLAVLETGQVLEIPEEDYDLVYAENFILCRCGLALARMETGHFSCHRCKISSRDEGMAELIRYEPFRLREWSCK